MTKAAFDIATIVGVVLIGIGVGAQYGWSGAAITVGALVIGLAFAEALAFGKRG